MQEMWKDVVGHEDILMISNLGNLYSKRSKRLLKLNYVKDGYVTYATKIGGRKGTAKCFKIHILVADAFLNSPTNEQLVWANKSYYGMVYVNHIDGNKYNNSVNNLEWVTGKENAQHYLNELNGMKELSTRRQSQASLTDENVRYAREQYKNGLSQRAIAKILNVSRDSVGRAIRGYKWVT